MIELLASAPQVVELAPELANLVTLFMTLVLFVAGALLVMGFRR